MTNRKKEKAEICFSLSFFFWLFRDFFFFTSLFYESDLVSFLSRVEISRPISSVQLHVQSAYLIGGQKKQTSQDTKTRAQIKPHKKKTHTNVLNTPLQHMCTCVCRLMKRGNPGGSLVYVCVPMERGASAGPVTRQSYWTTPTFPGF